MVLWQGRSKRKNTGGRLRYNRKKRKYEMAREQINTGIGESAVKKFRVRGNNIKVRLVTAGYANVTDKKTKKTKKAKIERVVENKANPHFVRRNIVTKGAIIKTEIGNAKVTSSPGQDGNINAILL